jgi:hypothetical protein
VGSVYIARWYWWRVNAWSEITAFVIALVCTLCFKALAGELDWLAQVVKGYPDQPLFKFPYSAALTVFISIPVWVTVTLLTRPVSEPHLVRFYEKVRPGGPGWRRIAARVPGSEKDGPGLATFGCILCALVALYATLLGIGKLILGEPETGAVLLAVAAAACAALAALLKRSMKKGDR